jgi:cytochrome c biogenesis factor
MKKLTHMQYLSLLWIARILGMFYAILLALFSLDAIKDGEPFWDNFVALILHLIPFILVVGVMVIGWRKYLITGIGYIIISIAFIYFFTNTSLVNKLIAIGPGILNGLLFIVVFYIKPETTPSRIHEKTAAKENP